MKRRDFIRRSVPATLLPFALNGFSFKAYGRSRFLENLLNTAVESDHVLVLIQLNGGNDGLNMIIPRDQYSAYVNARGNIAIPEAKILPLTAATGLHPAMTDFRNMYTEGTLAVLQSVGYPNPNFSHFRATDIWLTGSDYNVELTDGWMGRYLEEEFPGFPAGYPNTAMPDPLAIQIGSAVSTGLQGSSTSMGMAITNPTSFYNLVQGTTDPAPNTPAGHELTYVRLVAEQTNAYASSVKTAAGNASNLATYPANNPLADQLKIVARLVAGGLKTRIYVVNLGGFDNHSQQVVQSDTATGTHATLLGRISAAVQAFHSDLKQLNADGRVVGMTFSEFGRRIKSNASFGTDHGAAAPLFVFGTMVNGAVYGSNPTLPASATVNDNIPMQFDFRSVYASILQDWFGCSKSTLRDLLTPSPETPRDFAILPIIKTSATAVREPAEPASIQLYQNYPNPFTAGSAPTRIRFNSNGDPVRLSVFDSRGREISTLADGLLPAGAHEVPFSPGDLPSGTYYCRLQSGGEVRMRTMMLVK